MAVLVLVFQTVPANEEKWYSGDVVTSLSGLGLNNFFTATSAGLPQPTKNISATDVIIVRMTLRIDFEHDSRMMPNAELRHSSRGKRNNGAGAQRIFPRCRRGKGRRLLPQVKS